MSEGLRRGDISENRSWPFLGEIFYCHPNGTYYLVPWEDYDRLRAELDARTRLESGSGEALEELDRIIEEKNAEEDAEINRLRAEKKNLCLQASGLLGDVKHLQAVVAGVHEAIGESDASDDDSLPEVVGEIVTSLRAEVERLRGQRDALRIRLQQYAGEVQRAMLRVTATIDRWEKEPT